MKRFPFYRLKPKAGWITASLHYNPYCDLPPTVSHAITVNIEPIELGADAAMPEYEKVVDSSIILTDLTFEGRAWNALSGTYSFEDDQGGSFYVSSAHNPVTVHELVLKYLGAATYDADAKATFYFEHEDSGYADETTRLVFPATHNGFAFSVPHWADPADVQFPAEWKIPSVSHEWSPSTIREFAGRYIDLSQFAAVTIENGILTAKPTVT